jgi:hypothetical protein
MFLPKAVKAFLVLDTDDHGLLDTQSTIFPPKTNTKAAKM